MTTYDDPAVDPEACRRHDLEYGERVPIRSGWRVSAIRGKALTDEQIDRYERAGWYSAEFKEARRRMMDRKRKGLRREGNFDLIEGRMIYRP